MQSSIFFWDEREWIMLSESVIGPLAEGHHAEC